MTRWVSNEATTAQTFAHEIAHTLGIYHDFEIPRVNKNSRTQSCGPEKWVAGPRNQIMNYGRPRQSTWSKCSNSDFSNFYYRTYTTNGFCLKGKFDLNNKISLPFTDF